MHKHEPSSSSSPTSRCFSRLLGGLELECERYEEALEHLEASLAIQCEAGNRRFEGMVLGDLGVLHARQKRDHEAAAAFQDGEAVLRAITNKVELAKLLCKKASFVHGLGELQSATAIIGC